MYRPFVFVISIDNTSFLQKNEPQGRRLVESCIHSACRFPDKLERRDRKPRFWRWGVISVLFLSCISTMLRETDNNFLRRSTPTIIAMCYKKCDPIFNGIKLQIEEKRNRKEGWESLCGTILRTLIGLLSNWFKDVSLIVSGREYSWKRVNDRINIWQSVAHVGEPLRNHRSVEQDGEVVNQQQIAADGKYTFCYCWTRLRNTRRFEALTSGGPDCAVRLPR